MRIIKPQKPVRKIFSINEIFRPVLNENYPTTNTKNWEEWVFENFKPSGNETREYLPIFLTNITNLVIFNKYDIQTLKVQILSLDKNKKYWTVLQHDFGIEYLLPHIEELKQLDILYFSSSKNTNVPVPLMSRYDIGSGKDWNERTCFISFVGVIQNRHPLREKLRDCLSNKKDTVISETQTYEKFVELLKNTKFSLCPRGVGATSFRIQESLQAGCIPVYVSDEFILPFHQSYVEYVPFTDYGIIVKPDEIENLYSILSEITPEKIEHMLEIGKKVVKDYYSYEGALKMIQKILL